MKSFKGFFVFPILCTAILLCPNCTEAAAPSGWLQGEGNQQIDFRSVLDETHKLEKKFRAEVKRAEQSQPDWDSAPIKAELDKAVRRLEVKQEGDYSAYQSLRTLSCQTPLLDFELVKLAEAMFDALNPWYRPRYVMWIRSGNDTIAFIPFLRKECLRLKEQLARAEVRHACPEIHRMRSLFSQCADELEKGDTDQAYKCAWELLQVAQESRDYGITADVLDWHFLFLRAMSHRPNHEMYAAMGPYIYQEWCCVRNDRDFIATLDRIQDTRESDVVNELRDLHSEIVRQRRSGDHKTLDDLYTKFVDLASKSGDRTGAVSYFALNAYHAYLTTDRTTKNYNELRRQLYASWVAEELGKQPFVAQSNKKVGGDWSRIEKSFESVEKQSILVCRALQPCETWGGSNPSSLLDQVRDRPLTGLIHYQEPVAGEDLYLVCHAGNLVENDSQHVIDALMKSLIDAGFEPVRSEGQPSIVRVAGAWAKSETASR